ncbi:MAG: gluconate 2-dehydrogenase subunit 3 family protein [Bryobacteraceae bacterium]
MKRRNLLKSMLAAPALAAVPIPQPAAAQSSAPGASPDNFNVPLTAPDAVAQPAQHFFSRDQMAALENLGGILVPRSGDRPGSKETKAPKFLEFLISQSPLDRQQLYTNGLDRLNSDASRLYNKSFAALSAQEVKPILKPLEAAWTYAGPSDAFAQFLIAAKEDFLRACVNSPAYATAMAAVTRGSSGMNYYWFPVE